MTPDGDHYIWQPPECKKDLCLPKNRIEERQQALAWAIGRIRERIDRGDITQEEQNVFEAEKASLLIANKYLAVIEEIFEEYRENARKVDDLIQKTLGKK